MLLKEYLDRMLRAGIVTPSSSAWSFLVVTATKKNDQPRFCVNYRAPNRLMQLKMWPIPKPQKIFDALSEKRFFSSLDLFSGYWQIPMAEDCKAMTTFV